MEERNTYFREGIMYFSGRNSQINRLIEERPKAFLVAL